MIRVFTCEPLPPASCWTYLGGNRLCGVGKPARGFHVTGRWVPGKSRQRTSWWSRGSSSNAVRPVRRRYQNLVLYIEKTSLGVSGPTTDLHGISRICQWLSVTDIRAVIRPYSYAAEGVGRRRALPLTRPGFCRLRHCKEIWRLVLTKALC